MLDNKLRSLEELSRVVNKKDNIQYFRPEELTPHHAHKFQLYTGKRLEDMVESVKTFGILQPVIAREYGNLKEILIGHNRHNAAALAGKLVPTILIQADDELADEIVRESNIYQRGFQELPLSEQAEILKDHFEQLKKDGKKGNFVKSVEMEVNFTRDMLAADYGMSGRSISRKLRINYLISDLKKALDNGKLSLNTALELSYIKEEHQDIISEYYSQGIKISGSMAKRLRKTEESGALDEKTIEIIMCNKPEELIDIDTASEAELRSFLADYTNLPKWFIEKRTGEHYRKWDVLPGISIVVRYFYISVEDDESVEWFLVEKGKPFRSCEATLEDIIDFLKNDQ